VILIGLDRAGAQVRDPRPGDGPAKIAALAGATLALGATYWLLRERDDRTAGESSDDRRDLRHAQMSARGIAGSIACKPRCWC
jgi:hypothetical protein